MQYCNRMLKSNRIPVFYFSEALFEGSSGAFIRGIFYWRRVFYYRAYDNLYSSANVLSATVRGASILEEPLKQCADRAYMTSDIGVSLLR